MLSSATGHTTQDGFDTGIDSVRFDAGTLVIGNGNAIADGATFVGPPSPHGADNTMWILSEVVILNTAIADASVEAVAAFLNTHSQAGFEVSSFRQLIIAQAGDDTAFYLHSTDGQTGVAVDNLQRIGLLEDTIALSVSYAFESSLA